MASTFPSPPHHARVPSIEQLPNICWKQPEEYVRLKYALTANQPHQWIMINGRALQIADKFMIYNPINTSRQAKNYSQSISKYNIKSI